MEEEEAKEGEELEVEQEDDENLKAQDNQEVQGDDKTQEEGLGGRKMGATAENESEHKSGSTGS